MTTIERMAKEAGLDRSRCAKDPRWIGSHDQLAKFAALLAEDCAKVCDLQGFSLGSERAADAIRAKYPMPKATE